MSNIDLYNGDCLEVMDSLISQNITVDAIITDPPYGVNFSKIQGDFKDDVLRNIPLWYDRFHKLLREHSFLFLYIGVKNIENWILEGKKYFEFKNIITARAFNNGAKTPNNNFGFQSQHILVFSKGVGKKLNEVDFIPTSDAWYNDKRNKNPKKYTYEYPNFIKTDWSFATEKRASKNYHPTEKSIKLTQFLVEVSTNKGDLILDSFMGSGTTGLSCKNTNRNFIGIELDNKYFDIAKKKNL